MAEEIIEAYKEYEKEEEKLDQTITEKVAEALGISQDQVDVTIREDLIEIFLKTPPNIRRVNIVIHPARTGEELVEGLRLLKIIQ